jgi:secreted trypsin-like serine protease
MGYGTLVNTQSNNNGGFNLQTSGNGDGKGGTCSGDSGGPIFYPANSNQIVAVTSFGLNQWCRGTDFSYRVDRAAVQDWIATL